MIDMTIDSLDSVEEQYRGLYAQNDNGGYSLQVNSQTPPSTTGQNPPGNPPAQGGTAPKPTVVEVIPESVKEQLAELAKLKQAQEAAENDKLKAAGEFETLQKKMADKHSLELSAKDDAYNGILKKLHSNIIENSVMKSIAAHGGDAELLMPHILPSLSVGENDVIQVLGSDGSARLTAKEGSSDLMTVDEYVQSLRNHDKLSKLFEGANASGGGSKPLQKKVGPVTSRSQLKDVTQKCAYIQEHGQEAFNKLPA